MTTPYLLHYAPDNASLIVRLALEDLGVPYTTTLVDRTTQQQRSPAVHAAQTAEGLGPTPFTARTYATPPEGSAT